MFLNPCATPDHNDLLPLAFSMIDLSTIVFIGVTLKPVHKPAIIYWGPYVQNEGRTLSYLFIKIKFNSIKILESLERKVNKYTIILSCKLDETSFNFLRKGLKGLVWVKLLWK